MSAQNQDQAFVSSIVSAISQCTAQMTTSLDPRLDSALLFESSVASNYPSAYRSFLSIVTIVDPSPDDLVEAVVELFENIGLNTLTMGSFIALAPVVLDAKGSGTLVQPVLALPTTTFFTTGLLQDDSLSDATTVTLEYTSTTLPIDFIDTNSTITSSTLTGTKTSSSIPYDIGSKYLPTTSQTTTAGSGKGELELNNYLIAGSFLGLVGLL